MTSYVKPNHPRNPMNHTQNPVPCQQRHPRSVRLSDCLIFVLLVMVVLSLCVLLFVWPLRCHDDMLVKKES